MPLFIYLSIYLFDCGSLLLATGSSLVVVRRLVFVYLSHISQRNHFKSVSFENISNSITPSLLPRIPILGYFSAFNSKYLIDLVNNYVSINMIYSHPRMKKPKYSFGFSWEKDYRSTKGEIKAPDATIPAIPLSPGRSSGSPVRSKTLSTQS